MQDKSDFKMIPDGNELDTLERDLRFYPSVNASPQALSVEQIEQFNHAGYLRPISIFDETEIAGVRKYFDQLLNETVAAGGDSYSISSAHLKHGRVFDLLTDPRIVSLVTDLLGENVIGWGSHFFCKMPGDGKAVAWHQDASYWPLTPSKAVTVWLAIDDADLENGCMRFIEGSHHQGHLTYRPSDSGEHNVLNQTIENPEQYGTVVDDPLKAGQLSIHSDLLLHGSEANNSTRRRCALTLRYCAADVKAHLDWNQKGVVVSGQDASGHWSNRTRPESD
ncbi:MAG: phytanoyl-CoA dioxygenase family protein [Blastopirellula sp.]|nr:MAG: phytanoyl-CoA dioxygenase family protein [Blastopirellula sp.]